MWYTTCFDPSWVRCTNFNCRAEFIKASVRCRRKCPACKGIVILPKDREQLKPCHSPYCECEVGKCSHSGFYDDRANAWKIQQNIGKKTPMVNEDRFKVAEFDVSDKVMRDLNFPLQQIEISVTQDGKTLWLNCGATCILRITNIPKLLIKDYRDTDSVPSND